MPRWARFLSCGLTGQALLLVLFLVAAGSAEGGYEYTTRTLEYMATPYFWNMAMLFGLFALLGLFVGRVMKNIYHLSVLASGLTAGLVTGGGYVAFLLALHADSWGGFLPAIQKVQPALIYFLLPFIVTMTFTNWLWERLD